MRNYYKKILNDMFREELLHTRVSLGLTQRQMGERLEMEERSYAAKESGTEGCSAVTVILFLLFCCKDLDAFLAWIKEALEKVKAAV